MVVSELDIFNVIRLWENIPSADDDKDSESNGKVKYEEAMKLIQKLEVEKVEPWEIEVVWKYPFVRNCPKIVDAIMKRFLSISGIGKVYFGQKDPHRRKFTILFIIAENETSSRSYNTEERVSS